MGRIRACKNLARAIAIFEALAARPGGSRLRLEIWGAGGAKEIEALQARIAVSPASDAIAYCGCTSDPLRALEAADLLLHPSLHEGLPGVVLEALSVGTPVLASDLPGAREIAAAVHGINLLPLGAPDVSWADAAAAALDADDSDAILASFRRSPFRFEDHVDALAALWGLPKLPSTAADHESGHRVQSAEAEPCLAAA
jgi:glycosyltransferase involved in cell wall biosynthesis